MGTPESVQQKGYWSLALNEPLWPVGFQRACKVLENAQPVLITHLGPQQGKPGEPNWGGGKVTPIVILVRPFDRDVAA